ncbi:hypothetical protein ES703_97226 [subsurface metagenome]
MQKLKQVVCRLALSVAVVAALLTTLLVLPVQAADVLLPCSDCDKTENTAVVSVLPQGETEEIQLDFGYHTWGGDPDSDDVYGSGWLDLYMCLAGYWDESCTHLLYHTVWLD